ncbi:MAG: hypothetical protein M3Y82_09125 [Verrucomicrobiota bacterium]|nr:hypothetical protein [Verrucomicrobiota bacterium]
MQIRTILVELILFFVMTSSLQAENLPTQYAIAGELILTNFVSAPFPHPKRAQGYKNEKGEFFPAQKHYQDSTVAIFIPKGFRPGRKLDFVIHFHGWHNHVSGVLERYQLIEQFQESGRNAILIIPQGPFDAPDSFDGKLEDENGLKNFMSEVMSTLAQKNNFQKKEIGKIILSGHSGGYQVMASILARGGLSKQIEEVWLFDALYAQTKKFTDWFDQHSGRLLNIYTEHGGTKKETEKLMADLKNKNVSFLAKNEKEITPEDLQKNKLIFIFTELAHDEVLHKHKTFLQFLKTSCLETNEINRPKNK